MELTIKVKLDNAAFWDYEPEPVPTLHTVTELEYVLGQVKIDDELTGTLRDSNGNTVGHYEVT